MSTTETTTFELSCLRRNTWYEWFLTFLAVFCICAVSAEWARPDLVAKVAAGELCEAYASWWGFDPADSTTYLQSAIDSGVSKLIVEKMPSPWVVMPIRAASNQHVVFAKGAVLLAKRGEFVGRNDWLYSFCDVDNAVLTGHGATFRMWREDYAKGKDGRGRDYRRGEWRHTIAIRNSRNVRIEGLALEESGGDGIEIAGIHKQPKTFSRDIVLRDLVCDRHHRQGLSVVSVENLLVENCVFKNTFGTWPMDGVDLEPDAPENRMVNCVFRNCQSENNRGNGFEVALLQFRKTSIPVSVRFENCRTVGNRYAVAMSTKCPVTDGGYPQGIIDFGGCVFKGCNYMALYGKQMPENSIKVKFGNCRVLSFGKSDPTVPLALFEAPELDDPLPAVPDLSGIYCADIGSRERYRICTRNFASLGERDLPRLVAEIKDVRVVDRNPGEFAECTSPQMSGKTLRFLVFADKGRKVRVRAHRALEGGHHPLPEGEIAVTDLSGESVAKIRLPDCGSKEVAFDAPKSGFYWMTTCPGGGCSLGIEASDAPIAVDCTLLDWRSRPLLFLASTGAVYVPVAAGQEGAVTIGGDMPGSRVGMQVFSPDGNLAFAKSSVLDWTRYVMPRSENDGLWRVEFTNPSNCRAWAYYAEVTGVRPFFFLSRDKFWYSR